jgi:hypothetical protein
MKGEIRWATAVTVAGLYLLSAAGAASAYERTKTCDSYGTYSCDDGESPKPIAWPMRCIQYKVNELGSSHFQSSQDGTIGPRLRDIVTESFETWNAPSCTDFTFVSDGLTDVSAVRYRKDAGWQDNINLVVWRDNDWPHAGMDGAYALTSVTYNSNTGRIADADIEINSAMHRFTHFSESQVGNTSKVDMANTLVHEIGHFVGLDHSSEVDATMYRSAKEGEIKKRELHQDDIEGLCAAYPGNERDGACQYPEDFEPAPPGEGPNGGNGGCSGCSTSESPSDRGGSGSTGCSIVFRGAPQLPVALVVFFVAVVGLRRYTH